MPTFEGLKFYVYNATGASSLSHLTFIALSRPHRASLSINETVTHLSCLSSVSIHSYDSSGFCNPYEYFGYPHIWPRGYPLDQVKGPSCETFARTEATPLVLQVSCAPASAYTGTSSCHHFQANALQASRDILLSCPQSLESAIQLLPLARFADF